MRGINDDEVVDLARFGREKGVGVRFIEFMPLDAQGEWSHDKVVPAREILERIDAVFPLEPRRSRPRRARRALRVPRRRRRRRCDRERERAVLRQLRPRARSPPKASSARACSRSTRPTCAPCCARAAGSTNPISTTGSRPRSRARSARSGPAIASARSTSSARPVDEPDRRLSSAARAAVVRSGVSAGPTYTCPPMPPEFTHLDPLGRARMVDVTAKEPSHRRAVARCRVHMEAETASKIASGRDHQG